MIQKLTYAQKLNLNILYTENRLLFYAVRLFFNYYCVFGREQCVVLLYYSVGCND